jgi:hypothetical protein
MKTVLLAFALFLPAALVAQGSLQTFYNKYEGREGFTSVKISPKAFELAAAADLDEETMSLISQITGLNVLVFENEHGQSPELATQLRKEAYAALGPGYEELLSVKESQTDLKILARSADKGIITDLLIVGEDDGEFVYVEVTGKIDIGKLDMMGDMDIDGMEHLRKLDKK